MNWLMTNRWSNVPKTEVLAVAGTLAMPPRLIEGIRLASLALGKSIGVLMPVTSRVALSSFGAMVTPPRPAPKVNSLISVGLKLWFSVNERILPGPFFRSVMINGQFHDALVVP